MSTGRGHTTGDSKAAVLCVYRVERESAGKAGNLTSHSGPQCTSPGHDLKGRMALGHSREPRRPRRERHLTSDP